MNQFKNPNISLLIIWGVIILFPILYTIYKLSFAWFPTYEFYIMAIYFFVIILTIILRIIDYKLGSSIIKYSYTFICVFSLVLLFSIPIKKWQIKESERIGYTLIDYIETYKVNKGYYPENLHELVNEDYLDFIPKTKIGTSFNYERQNSDSGYLLYYLTYNGMRAFYINDIGWLYDD